MKLTTSDIKLICMQLVRGVCAECYFPEDLPKGDITTDRAIIATSKNDIGKYWGKCIVTFSVIVPDVAPHIANLSKLSAYEKKVQNLFIDGIAGEHEGEGYLVELQSIGLDNASNIRCHFVNAKLMFNTLNVTKE